MFLFGWIRRYKRYKAQIFKENNIEMVSLLISEDDEDFVKVNITKAHLAALHGNIDKFYEHIMKYQEDEYADIIDSYRQTPFHYAAKAGHQSFFARPEDETRRRIWKQLIKIWWNATDDEGNTILHLAAQHGHSNLCHVLAESNRTDLTQLNDAQESAYALAECKGHQLTAQQIEIAAKNKKIDLLNIKGQRVSPVIYALRNPHFDSESVKALIQQLPSLDIQDEQGVMVNVIDMYIEAVRKKNIVRDHITTFTGALCPAFTLAGFIGTLGGMNPEPISAFLLTFAAFFAVCGILVYATYKLRKEEYGKLAAETLFQTWQAAQLQTYQQRLQLLAQNTRLLKQEIAAAPDRQTLRQCRRDANTLAAEHRHLQALRAQFVTPTGELKCNYLTREEVTIKLKLAAGDPKALSKWAAGFESVSAFIAYNAAILCPVGTVCGAGALISSAVIGKVLGLGLLGAAAGALGGPIGIAVVTGLAALILVIAFGCLLYKGSYKKLQAERGKLNQEFNIAYQQAEHNLANTRQQQVTSRLESIPALIGERGASFEESFDLSMEQRQLAKDEPSAAPQGEVDGGRPQPRRNHSLPSGGGVFAGSPSFPASSGMEIEITNTDGLDCGQ